MSGDSHSEVWNQTNANAGYCGDDAKMSPDTLSENTSVSLDEHFSSEYKTAFSVFSFTVDRIQQTVIHSVLLQIHYTLYMFKWFCYQVNAVFIYIQVIDKMP